MQCRENIAFKILKLLAGKMSKISDFDTVGGASEAETSVSVEILKIKMNTYSKIIFKKSNVREDACDFHLKRNLHYIVPQTLCCFKEWSHSL